MRGVVHRLGRAPEIAGTGEPNEAVSQVLPLQQKEDHKDDDDAGRRQRLEERPGDLQNQLDGSRVGGADLDWDGLLWLGAWREDPGLVGRRAAWFLVRPGDLVAKIAQHRRGASDNTAVGRRLA